MHNETKPPARSNLPIRLMLLENLLAATLTQFEAEDNVHVLSLAMNRRDGQIEVRLRAVETDSGG